MDHYHFDIVNFAVIGATAVVFINLMRVLAAWLMDRGVGAGKTLGALVA